MRNETEEKIRFQISKATELFLMALGDIVVDGKKVYIQPKLTEFLFFIDKTYTSQIPDLSKSYT